MTFTAWAESDREIENQGSIWLPMLYGFGMQVCHPIYVCQRTGTTARHYIGVQILVILIDIDQVELPSGTSAVPTQEELQNEIHELQDRMAERDRPVRDVTRVREQEELHIRSQYIETQVVENLYTC